MPRDLTKRQLIEEKQRIAASQVSKWRALADKDEVARRIASRQTQIDALQAEIDTIKQQHLDAPDHFQDALKRKYAIDQELKQHEHRHAVNRLLKLAKQIGEQHNERSQGQDS